MPLKAGRCIWLNITGQSGTIYRDGEMKVEVGELNMTRYGEDGTIHEDKWFLWFVGGSESHCLGEIETDEKTPPLEKSVRTLAPKHGVAEVHRVFGGTILILQ